MKNTIFRCFVFILCFCVAWTAGMYFAYLNLGEFDKLTLQFNEVNRFVKKNHLTELDEESLVNSVLGSYVDALDDKYAKYYTAQEWEKFENGNKGIVNGIGIRIEVNNSGYVTVISVFANSPAARSGVEVGDVITKINDIEIFGRNVVDVANILQGKDCDTFDMVFNRRGETFVKTLTREIVELPSVEYCMDGYNGYIKISGFNNSTVNQFKEAIDSLQRDGAKSLVFDLRNNSGGTVDSVCKILNMLIPSGIIATQVTLGGQESVLGMSDENELSLPMATITNKNTASAAELFVCDLKDYNKAIQVGQTTYGKGVLQTTKRFSGGHAIKITTAYFNPAKSENFDKVGLKPDVEVFLDSKKEELYLKGKLELKDDDQYQAALKLLRSYMEK